MPRRCPDCDDLRRRLAEQSADLADAARREEALRLCLSVAAARERVLRERLGSHEDETMLEEE